MNKKSYDCDTHTVLSAVLTPNYMKKYGDVEELSADVNSLLDYAIDLFESISKNNNYCFGRTFPFQIMLFQDRIIITSSSDERANFLTFISLLQFVFIDEQIFLCGKIDTGKSIQYKNALFGSFLPPFACSSSKEFLIDVSKTFLDDENNSIFERDNHRYLAFLDIVYKYSSFKDAESNMLRHIIEPIKSALKSANKSQVAKFKLLLEYCNNYSNNNGFSQKHKIKI